jgi:hypothetical protein
MSGAYWNVPGRRRISREKGNLFSSSSFSKSNDPPVTFYSCETLNARGGKPGHFFPPPPQHIGSF